MEDEKIVELFLKRSQQALNETKEKYNTYCTVISSNILSDKQDTEECLNDAYLKLWNSVPPEKP
jgi:RNA polymerase sigma-70 factor (ECF subfamily)